MKSPHDVIKAPLVSEKGTLLTESANQVLFKVRPDANKIEVKYAVETLFKVKVTRVNTLNVRGKFRRQRTTQAGQSSNWKKAIVTLKEGDKIVLT